MVVKSSESPNHQISGHVTRMTVVGSGAIGIGSRDIHGAMRPLAMVATSGCHDHEAAEIGSQQILTENDTVGSCYMASGLVFAE